MTNPADIISQLNALNAEFVALAEPISAFEEPWGHIRIPDSLVDLDMNGKAFRAAASDLRAQAATADQIAAELDAMERNAADAEKTRTNLSDTAMHLYHDLAAIDEDAALALDLPILA